jgi:hypothetical protein
MTNINAEQLYRKIEKGDYKTAIIYDRVVTNAPKDLAHFERHDSETVAELLDNVREFVSLHNGVYSFVLKKASGGPLNSSCLVTVNLVPEHSETNSGAQMQGTPPESYDKIKANILAEIKAEMQVTMLQAQVNQYQAQLAEVNTTSGRMGLMIENFIMAKMGKSAPMFQAQPMQGTVNLENDESEVTDETFVSNMVKIKDKFGVGNLMKIAAKIDAKDPQIDMLINILNND